MTGMERNSDIVVMSCYAPLFRQRQPDQRTESFDAMEHRSHRLRRADQLRLPAYHAQKCSAPCTAMKSRD